MGNRKVEQVMRRVAEATPSGKLPSERETDAMRLVKSIGSVARKVTSKSDARAHRESEPRNMATSGSEPKR